MKYFIGQINIDWSDNRWEYKCDSNVPLRHKKGFIGLFDRNLQKFIWFKIIRKSLTKFGYEVERNGYVPLYWKNLNKL